MRIRFFLTVLSAGLFGAGFAVQACGSTTNDVATVADSGPEAAIEPVMKDSSVPDAKDAAPPCDTTADLTTKIPDASIADGASTSGLCVGCMKTVCPEALAACNMDCTCQGLAGDALNCFVKTQAISCGAPFLSGGSSTLAIGKQLLGCVSGGCADECAFSAFNMDGGADADADAEAGM
jgi:hypothetical protein